MKVTLLCSGSTGNCCVVEDMNTKIVIDCGSTKTYLMSTMKEMNMDKDTFDGIIITHGHTDHISQANSFKNLPMYATFPVKNIQNTIIGTHDTFAIGDLTITSLPLSHDFENTVGYKIVGSETLVYIADTGYVNERLFEELYNADYIVMESNHDPDMLAKTNRPFLTKQRILGDSGHLCNADCAEVLKHVIGPKTKEIILAHISREANTPELAYEVNYTALSQVFDMSKIRMRAAHAFEVLVMGGNHD